MKKTAPPFTFSASGQSLSDAVVSSRLPVLVDNWLLAGDINRHSERTIETRRERLSRLLWYFDHHPADSCGLSELRQFFHYLNHGHKEPGGRWGNPPMTEPLSSGRVKRYHSSLRTFFAWLVEEGEITQSPMQRIPPPVDRPDQIQPFSDDQLKALLAASKRSLHPRRDEAILLLLLDTGIRVSELCALVYSDIDLHGGNCTIRQGKGDKRRSVPFSRNTKRALYNFMNERDYEADAPLFVSDRGANAADALTRFGMKQMITRLGKVAGVKGVRCSPHTFRHSFAIGFLRAGGNVFTL